MDHKEYLLAELRCARLRAQLIVADIDAIGLALKAGMVTPEQALAHMNDTGLLRYLGSTDGLEKSDILPDSENFSGNAAESEKSATGNNQAGYGARQPGQ
jgi:hypothetical protein